MRRPLLVLCVFVCSSAFATDPSVTSRYLTVQDFGVFANKIQDQLNTTLKRQQEALQGALTKIQQNNQMQITSLRQQIETLSKQTATAVTVLNEKLTQLTAKAAKTN